jgi:hypothetical protein
MFTFRWRPVRAAAVAVSAVGIGWGLAAAPAANAAVPSPPFTQCPAIANSPSCEILLVVNSDNTVSVTGDPSVGPFDGSDDTLVGIVNDSSAAVKAVTVSGPGSDLSGFDGDGICSGDYGSWAGSTGCPYGTTGYEGPGASFVTSPSLPNSAEVDFSGGLAPGASAYFSLEGALTSAELAAREGSLVPFNCPSAGTSEPVTLKKVDVPVAIPGKPFSIEYGNLPLTFASTAASSGALCTVTTTKDGRLPVNLVFDRGPFTYHQHVADSVTSATVDFYPADASGTQVPTCDFSLLRALRNATTVPVLSDFTDTNGCLLNSSAHVSSGIIAKWTSPGFREEIGGKAVYQTPPLTYYADLNTIPGLDLSSAPSFDAILQAVETFIHTTLIANLPAVDRIGFVQDPPAHLTVTDPLGRTIGVNRDSSTVPGAGYAEIGGRSIAWFLEPVPGSYQVTASGPAYSLFSTEFTVIQLLGHGTDPLVQNSAWQGALGPRGTASKSFAVGGASLAPVLAPTESISGKRCQGQANTAAGQRVDFSLGRSVIPLGPDTVAWSFGDGSGGTENNPSHVYNAPGRYTPTVTVTDARGNIVKAQLPTIIVAKHREH